MNRESLHQAMLRPETYPVPEGPIEFRETHVSRLYLTPRHVYKIKKPVDFGFLDFTTLDRRLFYCEEEVRLNRRFAPDTYLDVAEIRRTTEGLRIAGDGEVVECAVHMRRLPEDRMLDYRLAAGDAALSAEMERLGRRLAILHAQSPVCRENGAADLERIRINWRENFTQVAPFTGDTISAPAQALVQTYVERFLHRHALLLRQREEVGYVRDGHGDLHSEHICLTEPIRIYDCIEFNRRFRVADIAADFAFLSMDLDFRRRRDLGDLLQLAYGADDSEFELLLPFYKVYRAFVRGKVESFLARDGEAPPATRRSAAGRAQEYFNLALGYLCPPVLVLIGGLMGTGKSTLGAALAAALRAPLLRSDSVRKELAGKQAGSGRSASFHAGIYTPEFSKRTYDLLLRRSRDMLAEGGSVVVDASFGQRRQREAFRAMARRSGIPSLLIVTACDRATALQRLDARQALGKDVSDGRRELFDAQAALFQSPAAEEDALTIDTLQSVAYNVQSLLCDIIARAGMRQ